MNQLLAALIFISLALAACTPDQTSAPAGANEGEPAYTVLGEDLAQFRRAFNAMSDKVRLVFIGGPACGICLRGMDDLNRSIVASLQTDPRAHTFMLEVPALGSTEQHAVDAIRLMPGPRVSHYWDEHGVSGLKFQSTLDIPMYAWDVWMIYEPGVTWDSDVPPAPAFWQHQLGGLERSKQLDAEVFANEVSARLAALPPAVASGEIRRVAATDDELFRVMQPRGYMIAQNHRSRGGYQKIKTLKTIRYRGETEAGGETYDLLLETGKPDRYRRVLGNGEARSVAAWDGRRMTLEGPDPALPDELLQELLISYDFDGWMTEWKDKGHKVWRLGMKQDGGRLAWVMEAELDNGRTWLIHVDSHTGDIYRHILVDDDDSETLALEFDDFRDVNGFRLAHEVRYFGAGTWLATDRFGEVDIEVEDAAEEAAP